jgi:rod shape-determining protein MreC
VAVSRRTGGRSRLTLALLVVTSIVLLTLDFRDAPVVQQARSAAATVFSPLRGVAEAASRPFTTAWNGVTGYGDLEDENERLRDRIADLEGQTVLEEDAAEQLAELLDQQGLDWVGAIPTQASRVVAGPASNFAHTIDINKGSKDGLKVNMPVVNGAGLVGRVVLVTPDRSSVQLITDPDFAVGVRLVTDGTVGTARGQGRDDPLRVDTLLEADTRVRRGTNLVTSGTDRFPASIPVGRVRDTEPSGGGLALDLIVRPMADTSRLAFVTVLLWPEQP